MSGTLMHLVLAAALIAVVLVVCRVKRLPLGETLALRLPPWRAFALLLLGFAVLATIEELVFRRLDVGDVKLWSLSPLQTVLRLLTVVVLAPLSEELVFRGLLYNRLADGGRRVLRAILVPAALFAASHYAPGEHGLLAVATLTQAFSDGAYLGFTRYRTNSTVAPIVLHALGNAFAAGQRLGWL